MQMKALTSKAPLNLLLRSFQSFDFLKESFGLIKLIKKNNFTISAAAKYIKWVFCIKQEFTAERTSEIAELKIIENLS